MDANEIITSITERVRDTANVRAVFGEPVETAGGVIVIPVAAVKIAGGGGGGTGRRREGEAEAPTGNDRGLGLGLRVTAMPLGYIEVKEGNARFVHIADMTKVAVAGMLTVSLVLLTTTRLMRLMVWKKRQNQKRWRKQRGRWH